jgi:acetyl-CoA C-acetyltransferase
VPGTAKLLCFRMEKIMSVNEDLMPVLIGCGQTTDRRGPEDAATPAQLMVEVARAAAADAGPGQVLLQALDAIVSVGLVVDADESGSAERGGYANLPKTVANALDITPAHYYYSHAGGNTPQMLVNHFAAQIASGQCSGVLLTGAEALDAMIGRLKLGLPMDDWQDDPGGQPERLGDGRAACTAHEVGYGIETPANTYPLFENALRGKYGLSLEQHRGKMGELYHRFCAVAARNPGSWFPTLRSAQEIATVSPSNRYVGFPYTKYLNSVIRVNQAAAVIMTSVARARELGVPEDRMVYLHGCGDAHDIWNVTERVDFASSPAVRTIGRKALAMAAKTIADMDYFDIYSCFPSAVQIACDELGIPHDDPRGLTVTGGLPYFGGPGNNYVMHSIATMMDRLRATPGKFGLLNANGWFVTKHALGIYSTTPVEHAWQREEPESYQPAINAQAHPAFTENPAGSARIETYTVLYDRKGAQRALIVGRLDDDTRFLAETPDDPALLQALTEREALGLPGTVSRVGDKNIFIPQFQEQ